MEIRIKSNKWLLYCSYYSSKLQVSSYLEELSNGIDTYPLKRNILEKSPQNLSVKNLAKL